MGTFVHYFLLCAVPLALIGFVAGTVKLARGRA